MSALDIKRLRLIACEVFLREMSALIASSPHQIDAGYLPKGLHDLGAKPMRSRLQQAVDGVDAESCDAILLGYGLCNNGLHHLEATSVPLVIPRAHDCITLFLGSRKRYMEVFQDKPGTYFLTSGWMERGGVGDDLKQFSIEEQNGMNMSYEELVEKYGEDNAEFLWEELCDTYKHYKRYAYIAMGVEPAHRFEAEAKERAAERGWEYERLEGDLGLLQRFLYGDWHEEDFLVVPVGHRIVANYADHIVHAEPVPE